MCSFFFLLYSASHRMTVVAGTRSRYIASRSGTKSLKDSDLVPTEIVVDLHSKSAAYARASATADL